MCVYLDAALRLLVPLSLSPYRLLPPSVPSSYSVFAFDHCCAFLHLNVSSYHLSPSRRTLGQNPWDVMSLSRRVPVGCRSLRKLSTSFPYLRLSANPSYILCVSQYQGCLQSSTRTPRTKELECSNLDSPTSYCQLVRRHSRYVDDLSHPGQSLVANLILLSHLNLTLSSLLSYVPLTSVSSAVIFLVSSCVTARPTLITPLSRVLFSVLLAPHCCNI